MAGPKKAYCLPGIAPIQVGLVEKASAHLQLRGISGGLDYHRAGPASTRKRPAGSNQTAPNFWVDPQNSVSYQINGQAPQYDMDSLDALRNLPILGGTTTGQPQILANVDDISRGTTSPVIDHYNIRPVINIYGSVDGEDLGYVATHLQQLVDASRKNLPRGSFITVRGQVNTMHDSFIGLYLGLAFSMVLVYLLMVVNFQSWVEPFIIITALPCALAGIVWMLFITHTTLSVTRRCPSGE